MSVPSSFFGSWTSDKNDNFDEYLESASVPWLLRKAILLAGHSITITNLSNGRYRTEQSMMGKSTKYEFGLNEEFENTGMDGVKHKITITLEGASLVEWHTNLDKPSKPVDKQVYSVEDGRLVQVYSVEEGRLVQSLNDGKVSCRRFFKRKN